VFVVPVIPAGVVVPCGGLMLRSVRHGRGRDALYVLLCPLEYRGKAGGRLSSGMVLRVQLGDGCVVYVLGLLFTVLLLCINCSWFEVESHSLFSVLIAGWYAL
jgi:hypothetical protein